MIKENYSFSDMANFLVGFGVPHEVIGGLADVFYSQLLKRPILNLFKFDDFLHEKYGDYESEGKSTADIFSEFFGDKVKEAEFYFAVSE